MPWVFLFQLWVHCTENLSIVITISWTVLFWCNSNCGCKNTTTLAIPHQCRCHMSWSNYIVVNIYHNLSMCKKFFNCLWKITYSAPFCQNDVSCITNHSKKMLHHHCLRVESPHNMVNILQNMDTQQLSQGCKIFLHFEFVGFLYNSVALHWTKLYPVCHHFN